MTTGVFATVPGAAGAGCLLWVPRSIFFCNAAASLTSGSAQEACVVPGRPVLNVLDTRQHLVINLIICIRHHIVIAVVAVSEDVQQQ